MESLRTDLVANMVGSRRCLPHSASSVTERKMTTVDQHETVDESRHIRDMAGVTAKNTNYHAKEGLDAQTKPADYPTVADSSTDCRSSLETHAVLSQQLRSNVHTGGMAEDFTCCGRCEESIGFAAQRCAPCAGMFL